MASAETAGNLLGFKTRRLPNRRPKLPARYVACNRFHYTPYEHIKKKRKNNSLTFSPRELYRQNDRRLSANLLQTFADRGCCVVSITDPYGRILDFLNRSHYYFFKLTLSCNHEAEWTPFQTYYSENVVAPVIEPGASGSLASKPAHYSTEVVHTSILWNLKNQKTYFISFRLQSWMWNLTVYGQYVDINCDLLCHDTTYICRCIVVVFVLVILC
jgi:hypothetical protein